MQAVCFQGVEQVATREVADPVIEQSTDVLVEVRLAGLCGSDLHPFHGREVGLDPGTIMGHEFVGRVVEAGNDVRAFSVGQEVFAPFSTSCGSCFYCRRGLSSRCERGQLFGWRSGGDGLHGCQAELVRVPLADGTLIPLPDNVSPEIALLLGDNFTTGLYCAKMAEIDPQGYYVVVGCGTVGLLSIVAALKLGASRIFAFDLNPQRATLAESLGTQAYSDSDNLREAVLSVTDGRGADAVMELVGLPEAQLLAYELVRSGGILSSIGCHCGPHFAFSPTDAYDKNLTYRTGRCPVRSMIDEAMSLAVGEEERLARLITHRFQIDQGTKAYDVFANRRDGCQKAVIEV